eukprot:2052713-Pleurochrysis_carterae.AAC.1
MVGRLCGTYACDRVVIWIGRQSYCKRVRLLANGPPWVRCLVKINIGGGDGARHARYPDVVRTGAE